MTPNTKPKTSISAVKELKSQGYSSADARRIDRGTLDIKKAEPVSPTPAVTTPVITPASLQGAQAPVVTPVPPPVVGPKLAADIATQTEDAFNTKLAQDKATAETTKNTSLQSYIDQLKQAKGMTALTADAYAQKGGVNEITPELNDINDKIRREQLSLRRATESVTGAGGQSKAQAQAQINNLTRESLAKQADLSVIQMAVQGRYDSAKEIADRAVSAQFEQQQQAIDVAKFDYTENKDLFTKAEQREYDSLFTDRQNRIAEAKQNASDIKQFALSALQAGASTGEVQRAMQAKTMDEAIGLVGGYLRPKPKATGTGMPAIKSINGVDHVWDATTGTFIPASEYISGGVASSESDKLTNQVAFLKNTINDAKTLVSATGPNLISQGLGKVFVGNTKAKQLANKLDTLKTNLLTLNSDPNLKKFFGPQMTEKDTALLMSAGSTLDAYNNSVKDNEAELERYNKLLTKIEKSIPQPVQGPIQSNIITSPDGLQIELID